MRNHTAFWMVVVLLVAAGSQAAERASSSDGWLAAAGRPSGELWAIKDEPQTQPAKAERKYPAVHELPLPGHTIEGLGGGAIVPMAYLTNPGPEGTQIGLPSVSFSNMVLGHKKSVQSVAITQTFFRRIELGCGQMNVDYVQLSTRQSFDVALSHYLAARKSRVR